MIYLLKLWRNTYPALNDIRYTTCTNKHRARGSSLLSCRNSRQLSNNAPPVNSRGSRKCLGLDSSHKRYSHMQTVSKDDQAFIVKFVCKFNYERDTRADQLYKWHNYSKNWDNINHLTRTTSCCKWLSPPAWSTFSRVSSGMTKTPSLMWEPAISGELFSGQVFLKSNNIKTLIDQR